MTNHADEVVSNATEVSPELQITTCTVYRIRWWILSLFVVSCSSSTMQWVQYSIIADVIVKYYGVSYDAVNWSAMVYLLMYIVFIIPGVVILDKVGLRKGVLFGMIGTSSGAWIKLFSVSPDRFWVVLLGQSVVAASQVFLLSIPPRLAAVWFRSDEVATACSIGIFGIQLGIAMGFLLPPMVVVNHDTKEAIEYGLYTMSLGVAIITSVFVVALLISFRETPQSPPSLAQLLIRENKDKLVNSIETLKKLVLNPSFVLLVLAFGINIGLFYAISMLLNQIILEHYPGASVDAGRIGLLIIVTGSISSVIFGIIMDKFNRFRETILIVYIFCLISTVAFNFTLTAGITVVYFTSALLGFFVTGFFPLGYELAAELTYPVQEDTSCGILTAIGQAFGIMFMYLYTFLNANAGNTWTNFIMCGILSLGICFVVCIRYDLKRQAVGTEKNLGIATAYVFSPMLVNTQMPTHDIERNLFMVSVAVAIFCSVLLLALLLFFQAAPPTSPSTTQLQRQKIQRSSFRTPLKKNICNPSYFLFLIAYGINLGVYYAISMLLNQIVLKYHPDGAADAGRIGLTIIIFGMIGSVAGGVILDKFRRFRETSLVLYGLSLVGTIAFTFVLDKRIEFIYLVSAIIGFSIAGVMTTGLEVGVELTYPQPEGTSGGLLTTSAQVFGIILTNLYSIIFYKFNDLWANLTMSFVLAIGIFLILCMRFDLRRQKARRVAEICK